jgi:hypothetical protein
MAGKPTNDTSSSYYGFPKWISDGKISIKFPDEKECFIKGTFFKFEVGKDFEEQYIKAINSSLGLCIEEI